MNPKISQKINVYILTILEYTKHIGSSKNMGFII